MIAHTQDEMARGHLADSNDNGRSEATTMDMGRNGETLARMADTAGGVEGDSDSAPQNAPVKSKRYADLIKATWGKSGEATLKVASIVAEARDRLDRASATWRETSECRGGR